MKGVIIMINLYDPRMSSPKGKTAVKITDATIHKRKNTHNREYSASLEAERI